MVTTTTTTTPVASPSHAASSPPAAVRLLDALRRAEQQATSPLPLLLESAVGVVGADAGVLLGLRGPADHSGPAASPRAEVFAVSPDRDRIGHWLEAAGRLSAAALASSATQSTAESRGTLIVTPLPLRSGAMAAAFVFKPMPEAMLRARTALVESIATAFVLSEVRARSQRQEQQTARLVRVIESAESAFAPAKFNEAAMTLVNDVAARWSAQRVSVGMVEGGGVRLVAMSQTEQIKRKMALCRAIEAAMDEAADQDAELMHPASESLPAVTRQTRKLGEEHGPTSVLALPLRVSGEVTGVLVIERPVGEPLPQSEAEALRLLADLSVTRLTERYRQDRMVLYRLRHGLRRSAAWVVGPRHTWAKVAAVTGAAILAALVLVQGTERVPATAEVVPIERHAVAASFEGYVAEAKARPGDEVEAGEVLARLQTAPLELELERARAEGQGFENQRRMARREDEPAKVRVAEAELARVEARIALLEDRIERASIESPLSGVVLEGNAHERVGESVSLGEPMYEIAADRTLRVSLLVPAARIASVHPEQSVQVAAEAMPGTYLAATVERIEPKAQVVDGENVFRVLAELEERPDWLRPGMRGAAKLEGPQKPYLLIWTRDVVEWVRMKLWI